MRSKKNSSLILLGVFTLGITQSYVVEALTETSANLAKESDNESKQQDIDVKQGTDIKKDEVKDPDSKSVSYLPFIMLGVVAIVVVVGIIVCFVRDNKEDKIIAGAIKYRKDQDYGDDQIESWQSSVLEIKMKIEKNLGENGLEFEDLVEILKDNSSKFLARLLKIPDGVFNKLFDKDNKEATKKILHSEHESTIKKFFYKFTDENAQKLFYSLIDTSPGLLDKYLFFMDDLKEIPFSGLALLFEKYKEVGFLEALLGGKTYNFPGEYGCFLNAILTGRYKNNVKKVNLAKDLDGNVIEFTGSIGDNIKNLYEEYSEDQEVITTLVSNYEKWQPPIDSVLKNNINEQKN